MVKAALQLFGVIALIGLISCQSSEENKQQSNRRQPLFTLLSSEQSGVDFSNPVPESVTMNSMVYEYYYNGGGVAAGDLNNDGLADIFFTANISPNKLYLNLGNLKFREATDAAGLKDSRSWTTGVTLADVNADGWLDIYICRSGKLDAQLRRNQLFINTGADKNGLPKFTEQAKKFGLDHPGYSTQALFFDYDHDGDLDMYLLNHNVESKVFFDVTTIKAKRDPLVGDVLFRNDGGKFIDVSEQAGIIGHALGYGLGVSAGDMNNDGWTDLYIANDYSERDYLYINNGDGTFSERLKERIQHISNFSMGTDIADYNNDGLLDIIVLDMVSEDNYGIKTSMSGMNPKLFADAVRNGFHYQYMFNTLQLNNGNGTFSEIGQLAGVSNTDWSWAPLFADFDNDGLKDLFVTNGLKRDFRNNDFRNFKKRQLKAAQANPKINRKLLVSQLIEMTPPRKASNYIFKNNGDLTFRKMSKDWGIERMSCSNGAAYADFDNDGDLELVTNNIDEKAFIYRNNSQKRRGSHFLRVKLVGPPQNPRGIGARVIIKNNGRQQVQELYLTRGYQSAVEAVVHFGLGKTTVIDELKVIWPDGKNETRTEVSADQILTLDYKNVESNQENQHVQAVSKQLFTDITLQTGVSYRHLENEYDDFQKESLLPHKMSNFGPGVAVGDIDGDGLDDFFVGAAKGYAGKLFLQKADGTFHPAKQQPWTKDKRCEDLGAVFFDADSDDDLDLYVVSGGNEFEPSSPHLQDRLYENDGQGQFSKTKNALPEMLTSGSVAVPGDFDNDGDADLFVGGRLIPGKYPYPPRSYLLRNDSGNFVDVTAELAPALLSPGLVTDALWIDFNNDQQLDLVIVGEWMPITLLRNNHGKFENATTNAGLEKTRGWWFSIAAEDYDNDGDPDLICGNLGLNYKYKTTPETPFQVFSADFDNNGSNDIVLGYYNNGELYPLRGRECSSRQMPFIKEKYPAYSAFARATLTDVYGREDLEKSLHYRADTFASSYLENLGEGRFSISPLPNLAQISSVNGILTRDFDSDGQMDIVIAGNLYAAEVETPRNDASVGLFLRGDGKGNFMPVPVIKSGFFVTGDVKQLAFLQIGGTEETAIVTVRNNDYLGFIKLN